MEQNAPVSGPLKNFPYFISWYFMVVHSCSYQVAELLYLRNRFRTDFDARILSHV